MSKAPVTVGLSVLWVLSVIVACSSSGSGGGTPGEGGATGSAGAGGATVNCDAVCPGVVAVKCTAGPVNQADCVSGCQTILSSKCASKYEVLYQCAGSTPAYVCDSSGHVSVSGCETAANDLYTCLAGGS